MTKKSKAGKTGFTLIEVLIALSVLGVTMTTVFTLFSAGLKLRMVTQDRLAFDRDARLVMSSLQDDLANLVPSGPLPMVSFDSIVLWRQACKQPAESEEYVVPLLVTYQWSGSSSQDSMLVRVATVLPADASNSNIIRQHFMKWARVFQLSNATTNHLLRQEEDLRFGTRATLNGLSGSWVSYPHIKGFACGISGIASNYSEEKSQSRILIKLSPNKFELSAPGVDPATKLALLPHDNTDIEIGFWLPLAAQIPVPTTEELVNGVMP